MSNSIQTPSGVFTLSEVTEEFLAEQMIDKKKYFDAHLIIAKNAWKKLFKETLYSVESQWLTVQDGDPYPFIYTPPGIQRLFSVTEVDHNGKMQPLFYNDQLNVITKPSTRSCGCTKCQCDGLCDDLSSTVVTTKLMFTINGISYYEKIWIKTCSNGDVIEWKETPTKNYHDFKGDGGDYNADYNSDYDSTNPGFANFSIETITTQKILCKLEVRPCGCPVDTPDNCDLIDTFCGCFFPFGFWHRRRDRVKTFLDDINSNHRGEVKMSDDKTKIFFKPNKHRRHPNEPLIPKFLQVNFQTNGDNCTGQTLIPDYAHEYMFTAMFYRKIRFNNRYGANEKKMAEYAMNHQEDKLILWLNPLNLQKLADVQDAVIQW